MIVDAYRALQLLVHHPRIDPTKIALLGVSRGGQGAVYAAMKRMRTAFGLPDAEFAGFLAMYPNCNTTYRDDAVTTGKPILILHGTADNYNPIAPCRAYVDRAKKAGANIRLLEYEGGQHGFDAEALRKPIQCKPCQTDRRCKLAEKEGGIIVNLETQKLFSYSDACVETGTTMAYSDVQGPKAHADAKEFFKTLFDLKLE
jgi:dienelactone hydrolase